MSGGTIVQFATFGRIRLPVRGCMVGMFWKGLPCRAYKLLELVDI